MSYGKCEGYKGPGGLRVKTKPAAWREHERMAQADDDDEEEEEGDGLDAEAAAAPAPAAAATDAPEKLEPLREYLVSLGADAGVLDGWRAEAKARKSGASEGTVDVSYISAAGRRFRSRKEVAKDLGLEV